MSHQFLSAGWIAAARDIREKYKDEAPMITVLTTLCFSSQASATWATETSRASAACRARFALCPTWNITI